jgi:hypothetical protein
LFQCSQLGRLATDGLKSVLETYSHATMMDLYLSRQGGQNPHGIHMRLLEVKVFTITLFTFPAGSLPEQPRLDHSLVAHHLHNCCKILKQRYL